MKPIAAEIREMLAKNGLRVTQQRIEILKLLMADYTHPTAEELFARLHLKFPALSLATVYKTLEILVSRNLIRKLRSDGLAVRFDADTSEHYHLVDIKTDKVTDFKDEELINLINNYIENKNDLNFKVRQIQLNIFGETIN